MCTRPDRRSIPTSVHALRDAAVAVLLALGVLFLALLSAPVRFLRRRRRPHDPRPATVAHVDVQVHLEDTRSVAELKRVIRQTLRRTACTWAPLPLPIDRVVVGVGFPATGKVDLYADFPAHQGGGDHTVASHPLVVVTLGLRDGEREIEPAEVAAALATQIQAVIDDRYRQRSTATPTTAAASTPVRTAPAVQPVQPAQRVALTASRPAPAPSGTGMAGVSMPRLQELLATVQQGQPLDAAGPASVNTDP